MVKVLCKAQIVMMSKILPVIMVCVPLVLLGDAALKKELLKFMAEHPSVARFAVSTSSHSWLSFLASPAAHHFTWKVGL